MLMGSVSFERPSKFPIGGGEAGTNTYFLCDWSVLCLLFRANLLTTLLGKSCKACAGVYTQRSAAEKIITWQHRNSITIISATTIVYVWCKGLVGKEGKRFRQPPEVMKGCFNPMRKGWHDDDNPPTRFLLPLFLRLLSVFYFIFWNHKGVINCACASHYVTDFTIYKLPVM